MSLGEIFTLQKKYSLQAAGYPFFPSLEKNIEMAMIHLESTRMHLLGETHNLANEKTPYKKNLAKWTWDESGIFTFNE